MLLPKPKTLHIGRITITISRKQKHNPFDIVIKPQQPAAGFNGLWSENMLHDYDEYCKANKEGRYIPDPRD